ncbi:hypothetical protein CJO75_12795 [Ralstonia solanacearum]|uniref:Uncharacterized protein n=1 Tax=Ralstonia solanacearum TaxID=305 RepID=A0AA86M229_RALSL|nr:hypothetical protein CIG66_12625 [Ralstonia pseudosolanacearum]AVV67827.1 hypothetical protein RSOE_12165 [Ralstonia solanacearum OE1-1]AXV74065.1 hypothetical protein CJO75_12795 [Ralstonia solanacearum]AXW15607.1 hypothetical protein CJO84_12985 [Ralstonia solanacearum]AXW39157.1 hypothetical protein CJO89_13360 [Ralstonia solanacearum]
MIERKASSCVLAVVTVADDRDARLHLCEAGCGLLACGLRGCDQFTEATLGGCDGAFEPLVRTVERDKDADTVIAHLY